MFATQRLQDLKKTFPSLLDKMLHTWSSLSLDLLPSNKTWAWLCVGLPGPVSQFITAFHFFGLTQEKRVDKTQDLVSVLKRSLF